MFENNESMNTVHWFDAFSSATPMNNPITLISPVESLGYIFVAAGSLCVTLQISEQFSPKARTPTHWMPSWDQILTQNDHSRSFKVIRFGVNEEPLRGYIVQYNNCGLECEGSEDNGERKKRKLPFATTPLSFDAPSLATPSNMYINLTFLETRIPGLQFCR